MYLPNMKSVTLPVYDILEIEVWGGAKPNLGKGAVEGRRWYRSKDR